MAIIDQTPGRIERGGDPWLPVEEVIRALTAQIRHLGVAPFSPEG